jgi:hypothetical protein
MGGALTEFHVPDTAPRVGRKKEWHEQLRLPLAEGTTARIDSVLTPGEPRLDMIREAIEKEILRRRTLISRQRQAVARITEGE